MPTLRVLKTSEIDDITDRLRTVNNYITMLLNEASGDVSTKAFLFMKRKALQYAQKEIDKVSEIIMKKLEPVIQSAIEQTVILQILTQIPTSPEEVVTYLPNMIQHLFGKPLANFISLLASYVEPIMRLANEIQRTQSLINQTMALGSSFKIQAPDIRQIISDH